MAAIAPYADAPVTIQGIAHIRGQESDRKYSGKVFLQHEGFSMAMPSVRSPVMANAIAALWSSYVLIFAQEYHKAPIQMAGEVVELLAESGTFQEIAAQIGSPQSPRCASPIT